MRLRFAFLMFCMLIGATVANAQFNAVLVNELQPLTLACGSGAPVPDGTTVQIFWDSLGNGPTDDDNQPIEGPGFLQVNFNQFNLNGASLLEIPGGFGTDPFFAMASGIPDPAQNTGHPLYWLRVCLDTEGIYWQSDTFRVFTGGITEVYFGVGDGLVPFTCLTGVCAGCPSPPPVENLVASQAFCDSIVLTWEHDQIDIDGYRILVDNTEPYIYIPNPATTRYVDLVGIGGQDHTYGVRAYRICGTGQDADTARSTRATTTGRKLVGPPTPQNLTASDDECGRVLVSWSVNTILGLDMFVILRDDVPLDTIDNHNAGFVEQFFDNAPLAGVHEYCVRGTSVNCSDGPEACDNGAAGAGPNCTITNVDASDDDCDEICITWTATCADADSFEIFRNNTRVTAVFNTGGPNFTLCYTAPIGTGTFQIRAKNACGNGALTPNPGVSGTRLGPPTAVQDIVASDNLCDKVRVTWTDHPEADSYRILRQGGEIGTVAGDVNVYDDFTAVPGQTRTYTVVAVSECGAGVAATGNGGTRLVAGTGTATFALVTAGPPNWTYSMTVLTGCLNRVVIRDYCEGTTATAPTGWTVVVNGLDSIVYSSATAAGAGETVTGFGLSHPTCDGNGRWGSGQSGGSIRGPLPVGENAEIPTEYGVKVFPNPFNPQTNFRIAIPQASDTRILVFNINGQLVREMSLGRMQAGFHTVQFGGADLPSGMYFARVQSGVFHSTHKLMLLK